MYPALHSASSSQALGEYKQIVVYWFKQNKIRMFNLLTPFSATQSQTHD